MRRRVLAVGAPLCLVGVGLFVAGNVLGVHARSAGVPDGLRWGWGELVFTLVMLSFVVVGGLVVSLRPGHVIGWLLLAEGLFWELGGFLVGYVAYGVFAAPGSLPVGRPAAWLLEWLWVAPIALLPFIFLLFPDGRLPSARWRPVAWLAAIGPVVIVLGEAFAPGPLDSAPPIDNPFGVSGVNPIFAGAEMLGNLVGTAVFVASVASVFLRFRAARGPERRQLEWLMFGAVVVLAGFVVAEVLGRLGFPSALTSSFHTLPLAALPVAVGVAVLRYRLYEIDVVVSRTLVAVIVAGVVAAVYLMVVVGVGAILGGTTQVRVVLAVAATALLAVFLERVHRRALRVARRVVYRSSGEDVAADEVAIRVLGGFRLVRGGSPLPTSVWQSKKARDLLKILIAHRGHPVNREAIMELLWPGQDPAKVANRLAVAVSTVRSVLDPDKRHPPQHVLVGDADALRVDLAHLSVDVEAFLAATGEGLALLRSGQRGQAGAALAAAEAAYDGEAFAEDLYEDWAGPLREQAREAYAAAARALAGEATQSGNYGAAVRYFLRLLEYDEWDEEAHVGLIRALERAGRHGEARRRYRVYQSRMDELGLPAAPFPAPVARG